jgi:hypothetical protein
MARKPSPKAVRPLFRLEPGYDNRGNSPWHWLEANVPQELYFAFFSDRKLAPKWSPLTVRLVRERNQGDFFYLSSLFAATLPAVEAIQGLLGNKVEALPIQVKGKGNSLPPLFLLHPLEVVELSKQAIIDRFEDGRIMHVDKFAFTQRAVARSHFFSACGDSGNYIVSEKFRATVEEASLHGLSFGQLRGYPTPGRTTGSS